MFSTSKHQFTQNTGCLQCLYNWCKIVSKVQSQVEFCKYLAHCLTYSSNLHQQMLTKLPQFASDRILNLGKIKEQTTKKVLVSKLSTQQGLLIIQIQELAKHSHKFKHSTFVGGGWQ